MNIKHKLDVSLVDCTPRHDNDPCLVVTVLSWHTRSLISKTTSVNLQKPIVILDSHSRYDGCPPQTRFMSTPSPRCSHRENPAEDRGRLYIHGGVISFDDFLDRDIVVRFRKANHSRAGKPTIWFKTRELYRNLLERFHAKALHYISNGRTK